MSEQRENFFAIDIRNTNEWAGLCNMFMNVNKIFVYKFSFSMIYKFELKKKTRNGFMPRKFAWIQDKLVIRPELLVNADARLSPV